jgi:hypothetical protein
MGTNISKEGITKDLEAMHKAGFEGAIIMHVYGFVDGKPLWPERTFRSPYWWEAVKLLALAFATSLQAEQTLEQRFESPPDSAQPGVYWYFNDGNLNSKEMTAELENMKEVGINKVLFLEVDLGIPKGPV